MQEDAKDRADWDAVEEATELLHEERYREAMIELRRALQENPKNAYAYYFLGMAMFEIGELEPARDAYAASVKLAPQYLGARVALCHLLRLTGDVRGAIREGLAALSQAPGDADTLYAVGLAYNARGDDAATRMYLEAYLATSPEFEVATETRALLASLGGGVPTPGEEDEEDEEDP